MKSNERSRSCGAHTEADVSEKPDLALLRFIRLRYVRDPTNLVARSVEADDASIAQELW
jgi:hypothetical protein